MQKRGLTARGTQRWYCPSCRVSATRKRPDKILAGHTYWFHLWLTGTKSLREIAVEARVSARTLERWFEPLWELPNQVRPEQDTVLILDATSLESRCRVILIARNLTEVRYWHIADRENSMSWNTLCSALPAPSTVVCDAQKGLLTAIHTLWPETYIQRCVIHVHRQAFTWLTKHPKTEAGRELRDIVHALLSVQTRRQKRRWIRMFHKWEHRHGPFLSERTKAEPGSARKWWYTHRILRGTRSLIRNAIPDLFRYVAHPKIPRTSNLLEGGINAPLQERRFRHRGMQISHKEVLAAHYLQSRSEQKPPRNVY